MMIVTIAALVMAASLGWFAYRLLQEEQRRSDARVAVLTAALDADAPTTWDSPVRTAPSGVAARTAMPTPPLPAAPTPTETRANRVALPALVYLEDDTRQVSAFPSESADEPPVWHTSSAPVSQDMEADDLVVSPTRASGLFADVPEARRGDARGAIALAGIVLVGLLAMGYVWFGRPTPPATPAAAAESRTPATAGLTQGGMPLELLALSHEQRNGLLVVRGRVRNPVAGSDRSGVVASVMLLDLAGGVLDSARSPIDTTRLRPGDEVGFAAEMPAHKDVRRYRVTFRGVDGALVPHADRRAARP